MNAAPKATGGRQDPDRPWFWLPANFEPAEVLPVRLHQRGDDARWLVGTVLRKWLRKTPTCSAMLACTLQFCGG